MVKLLLHLYYGAYLLFIICKLKYGCIGTMKLPLCYIGVTYFISKTVLNVYNAGFVSNVV